MDMQNQRLSRGRFLKLASPASAQTIALFGNQLNGNPAPGLNKQATAAEIPHYRPRSFLLHGEPSPGPLLRLELIPDPPPWAPMAPADTLTRFMVWSDEPGRYLHSRQAPLNQRRPGALGNWLIGAVWFRAGEFELCLHNANEAVMLNDHRVQPPEGGPWAHPRAPLRDGDRLIFEQFGLEYAVSIRPAGERERQLRDTAPRGPLAPAIHRGLPTPWHQAPWMMTVAGLLEALCGPDDVELCILLPQGAAPGQGEDWELAPRFLPVLRQRLGKRGVILKEALSLWDECPLSYGDSRYDLHQFIRVANVLSLGKPRYVPGVTAHFRLTSRSLATADYLRARGGEPPPCDQGSHRPMGATLIPSDANDLSASECSTALLEWVREWWTPEDPDAAKPA